MKSLLMLFAAIPALSQPTFTVASMKPTQFLPHKRPVVTISPGRVYLTGLTLQSMIARAYGVKEYQVRGPDWIASERYTVTATMPTDAAEPAVWLMVRSLLSERVQLKVRRASEEKHVFALVPAKGGPKLKASAGGEPGISFKGGMVTATNATMDRLATLLGNIVERPVIDSTGLNGAYDFKLAFTPDGSLGDTMSKIAAEMEHAGTPMAGPSIYGALQQQLGLRLDPRKMAIDVLVVENVVRVPTED